MAKTLIGLLFVVVISLWAIWPFFQPGFFPIHDDTQVVRVSQMAKALSDGHFPVRWVKDLGYGYGYPIFNFYAPLPYYVGSFVNLLGANALTATKTMMAIGILLAGVSMYFLTREFWGELGGVVSGLFYVYAPYHAVDIYVRGAVGEFWAYAFLPLLFLGLWKSYKEQRGQWVIIGAMGLAGVVLSHNLTAMMTIPFIIALLLLFAIKAKKLSALSPMLSAILLGLGLATFYWLPAIVEIGYTNVTSQIGGGADFRDHFACWQQLWDSHWGFGGSTAGCDLDGLSLKIGKLHALVSLAALVGAFYFWKKHKLQSKAVLLASGFWLLAAFMTIELSRPIWEAVQPLAYLQYPWRFLLLISFFSSFIAGFLVKTFRFSLVTAVILLVLLFYSNTKLFQPHYIEGKSTSDFIRKENITWVTSKISDEYMPKDFKKPMDEVDAVKRRVQVGVIKADKTQELVFATNEKETKAIHISIAPFPAWQAFIDGSTVSYALLPNGIELTIPQGPHIIKISYISTPIEKLGNVISIIGIAVLTSSILLYKAGYKTRFFRKPWEK